MKVVYVVMVCMGFLLPSCAVYSPNTLNTPNLKEKGDLHVGGHVGNGLNGQAAYAVTDHIGVMANYMHLKSKAESETSDDREGTGKLFETGLGYFIRCGESNVSEFYSGYGLGNVSITKTSPQNVIKTLKVNGSKFFIQPGWVYSKRFFEVGLNARMSFVKFSNLQTTYTKDDLQIDDFEDITTPTWIFLEPAVTIRAGLEKIKFQLQIGHSFKLNDKNLGYEAGLFSAGIVAKL
jgi:hypothetical protein